MGWGGPVRAAELEQEVTEDEVGSFEPRAWRGQSGAGVEEPLGE